MELNEVEQEFTFQYQNEVRYRQVQEILLYTSNSPNQNKANHLFI